MGLPGRHQQWVCAAVVWLLLFVPPADAADKTALRELDGAIGTALEWMQRHPATPVDGGLLDMIDEGIFFLMMRERAPTSHEHERYAQALRTRMQRVQALPAFERWVERPVKPLIDHYHLLLAAHLMRLAGDPSSREDGIVAAARQALGRPSRDPPTVRLTVALLIERLGGTSPVSLDRLRRHSLIASIGRGYRLPLSSGATDPRQSGLLLYALVHEVLAWTDFGRRRPPPWLEQRIDAVVPVLAAGVAWGRGIEHVDLVAELMVVADLLGASSQDAFTDATLWLARTQRPDGSWGPQRTPRANKVRHATMTAAFALVTYRGVLATNAISATGRACHVAFTGTESPDRTAKPSLPVLLLEEPVVLRALAQHRGPAGRTPGLLAGCPAAMGHALAAFGADAIPLRPEMVRLMDRHAKPPGTRLSLVSAMPGSAPGATATMTSPKPGLDSASAVTPGVGA